MSASDPGVPILSVARRVAAFGISDLEPFEVSEGRWRSLLELLVRQRLTGLASAGVRRGWLLVSSEQEAELIERQREAMLKALALERTLVELAEAFEAGEVPFTVLKGPAVAHSVYPEPEWRPFGDVDVLVRQDDWIQAQAALVHGGFRRELPEPRAGFDRRFGKAATYANAEGMRVDLHRTLAVGPFGSWINPTELLAGTREFDLGGRSMLRLDNESMLVHACVHAVLGWRPPLLLAVRDVAQIISSASIDSAVLAERVRRWRLRTVVSHALRLTADLAGGVGHDVIAVVPDTEPHRQERRALLAYTSKYRRHGAINVATLRSLPRLRDRARYVAALVLPSREFMAARSHGSSGSYAKRWTMPLRWLRRRTEIAAGRKRRDGRHDARAGNRLAS